MREKLSILFEKNINATGFRNQEWVPNLTFWVNLTSSHLDNLNLQLQGKLQLIHEMRSYVRAFETKLRLWEIQLGNAYYAHFATLQENKPMSTTLFVSTIRHLRTEFSSRLAVLHRLKNSEAVYPACRKRRLLGTYQLQSDC